MCSEIQSEISHEGKSLDVLLDTNFEWCEQSVFTDIYCSFNGISLEDVQIKLRCSCLVFYHDKPPKNKIEEWEIVKEIVVLQN